VIRQPRRGSRARGDEAKRSSRSQECGIQEDRGRARGGAKISARIAVATPNVVIAPDLSHAWGLHRPGYRRSRQLRNAGRWIVHGAAQIRRGKMMGKNDPRRAEIFAPPNLPAETHLSPTARSAPVLLDSGSWLLLPCLPVPLERRRKFFVRYRVNPRLIQDLDDGKDFAGSVDATGSGVGFSGGIKGS
jgi:hypothetical protein